MVQSESVPVRIPCDHGMDVRNRQDKICMDAAYPGRMVYVCHGYIHCECPDWFPYSVARRIHHRCCCGSGLRGGADLVR